MNSFKQKWAGYSEKKKRILTALACILCFILLLSLFIALKLARIQYDPAPETEHEEPASTPAETDQQFAEKGRSTVNILVLGTDLPLPGTGDLGRCDSTTLLSLNLLTGQIKAISFERGISIYIPSIWSYDLLTHVYSHEGATGMVNAIETNFGVDIDGYVQINFDTFPQVVDAIGGVDIDLTDEERPATFIQKTDDAVSPEISGRTARENNIQRNRNHQSGYGCLRTDSHGSEQGGKMPHSGCIPYNYTDHDTGKGIDIRGMIDHSIDKITGQADDGAAYRAAQVGAQNSSEGIKPYHQTEVSRNVPSCYIQQNAEDGKQGNLVDFPFFQTDHL